MIVSFLNQKGGTGKTTLSIHFAHALALKEFKVLLVDSDPQASSRDWRAARKQEAPFNLIGLDRPILHAEVPKLAKDYDYVVIDGAPRVSELTRSAIMASDLILIPIQPSPLDTWATDEIVSLINESMIYKPDLAAAFVSSRVIVNTNIGRELKGLLEEYPYPVLNSSVSQRVPFAESLNLGSTVLETDPKSSAAQEIWSLVDEVLSSVEEVAHG